MINLNFMFLKKAIPVIVLATFCLMKNASAKIWRVNNKAEAPYGANMGGTEANPVFQQIYTTGTGAQYSAVGSGYAQYGDTIHLEGSTTTYSNANNLKIKLTIIGPGFFLTENPNVSNDKLEARISQISFDSGSEGSHLMGVHVTTYLGIGMGVNNIVIKRCLIDQHIAVGAGVSDLTIIQNYFSRTNALTIFNENSPYASGMVFNNNIVLGNLIAANSAFLECKNNIFVCSTAVVGGPSLRMNVSSFQNNIIVNAGASVSINGGSNLDVSYNISSNTNTPQFGTGNNNIAIANIYSALFADTGSSDGKYKLKPGVAPSGSDGTERGAFGGAAPTNRYTLSGLAPIPVIYEISTSGVADATGLPVTIKAKTIL
jgi:hypothetical protein